jgi:hypothetical protein
MLPKKLVVSRNRSRDRVLDRQDPEAGFAGYDRFRNRVERGIAARARTGDERARGDVAERARMPLIRDDAQNQPPIFGKIARTLAARESSGGTRRK